MVLNSSIKRHFDTQNLKHSVISILTTFTRKNCVLLSSVQEFIETEGWLTLTFFTSSFIQ